MIGDKLTRAFYAVAGRDAEYILANTCFIRDAKPGARNRIAFDWHCARPLLYLVPNPADVSVFHELAHAYHIHHWPVVSHFCAVERCEEAASCLTWMAAYLGVLRYEDVREHDQAISDPRQRANMLTGQRVASGWDGTGARQRNVNHVIRSLIHADLR